MTVGKRRLITPEQAERKRQRERARKAAMTPEQRREINRAYREKHREKVKAKKAAEYRADPERFKARNRAWKLANPEKYRRRNAVRHRAKTYGLTPEGLTRLLAAQHEACAICGAPLYGGPETCVDHDHTTGAVRGLLCQNDNKALGLLTDDPARLRRAASYLETHNRRQTPQQERDNGDPESEAAA